MSESNVVIVGGGVSGLMAAYHLRGTDHNVVLHEASSGVGGLCSKRTSGEYSFETGLRYLHYDADVEKMLQDIGVKYQVVPRGVWVQRGLVRKRHPLPSEKPKTVMTENFELFLAANFEEPAQSFIRDYTEKSMLTDASDITCFGQLLRKADTGDKAIFVKGGLSALIGALQDTLQFEVVRNSRLTGVNMPRKVAFFEEDKTAESIVYDKLVTTIPLQKFVPMLRLPFDVERSIAGLGHVDTLMCYIACEETLVDRDVNSIYLPDRDILPHRVSFLKNYTLESDTLEHQLCAEISVPANMVVDTRQKHKVVSETISGLERLGILSARSVVHTAVERVPFSYLLENNWSEKAMQSYNGLLSQNDIFSLGRFAEWNQDNIVQTMKKAKALSGVL